MNDLISLTVLVMIGARLCGLLSHAWSGPPEERVAALKGVGVCALFLVLAGFLFVLL